MNFAFTGDVTTDVAEMFRLAAVDVRNALNARFESSDYTPIARMLMGAIVMTPGGREIRESKAFRTKKGDLDGTFRVDHAVFKTGDDLLRRQMMFGLALTCISANRRSLETASAESTRRLEQDLKAFGQQERWYVPHEQAG